MLHILWILIKFILILAGILLGLILLAVLLLLFCPVRYSAAVAKETSSFRDISAHAKVSWLFGGIAIHFDYSREQTKSDFRLFGIPLLKLIQHFRSRKISHNKRPTSSVQETLSDTNISGSYSETDPAPSVSDTISEKTDSLFPPSSDFSEKATAEEQTKEEKEAELHYWKIKIEGFFFRLGNICRTICDHIRYFLEKIKKIPSTVENFSLTIENICAKIEAYRSFLEHPRTRAAFSLVKTKFQKLLRHVFPTKIQGTLTFGSTDPSVTGTVLAVLGMTIPLHQNCISVTPVFEDRNILEGSVQLKGRVYGFLLVRTAVELYFNKNIKYVIRRWKHNKED
ncbi:DUF2953 domain-containing protein [Blautia sp. MSJ-19]|uniref:DUF2953 domain-containing protein n=1 Tax=Blautia sp. MSJ-19 TaxID=2841517 RepID=UPI001C0EA8A0|nr:DUF2953 domain-containing protein [Blautia sp. MSJ-19]MBU5481941.1 DUF2953 domain-containing protein [Blautia sp. MSJ-19]